MKQTARIISTYAADVSGVCSALYELGGMSVIHDPSGCNSTYNTHDEPRWYDQDSMVFISALTEIQAITGDDEKLIGDLTEAAGDLHPRFVALCGSPIPMLIGTDLHAIAAEVERRTRIPSFALDTNSMHSYLTGAGAAFAALADRFMDKTAKRESGKTINLLGLTPLDFSINGTAESIRAFLEANGYAVVSSWAMGTTLDDIRASGRAAVNLAVSYAGIPAAKKLKALFGTPYVAGVPFGKNFPDKLLKALSDSAADGKDRVPYTGRQPGEDLTVIGESVTSGSLAAALASECGVGVRVLCPLETEAALLDKCDRTSPDEDDLIPLLRPEDTIVADPLYNPICPAGSRFYSLPSESFSGRIFRKKIPNLINTEITKGLNRL